MTEGTSAAPATVQDSAGIVDEWWATEADEVEGHDLLRDDALYDLVGVPFVGLKAIFRDGIQRKGAKYRDDYVSLELRVAPTQTILASLSRIQARRRSFDVPELTAEQLASLPGEQLVINDGSTGLYRQIVEYLAAKELITLPEGDEQGEKGETIFDLPRSQWVKGTDEATEGIEIRLRCSRGLRFSDYSNEYTGDNEKARTWYIA
jgi:hypothetical protein